MDTIKNLVLTLLLIAFLTGAAHFAASYTERTSYTMDETSVGHMTGTWSISLAEEVYYYELRLEEGTVNGYWINDVNKSEEQFEQDILVFSVQSISGLHGEALYYVTSGKDPVECSFSWKSESELEVEYFVDEYTVKERWQKID